jgi:8-oxo-dGTP diphosphatase
MLKRLLGAIWKNAPKRIRRLSVWFMEPRFTVTTGAVVIDDNGRLLLLKHAFRGGSGWGIPGGFMEKGEHPDEAVRRELREEVGLEVELLGIAFARTFKRPQQVELIYLCHPLGSAAPKNYEIERAEWFDLKNLPKNLGQDQRLIINRVLSMANKS